MHALVLALLLSNAGQDVATTASPWRRRDADQADLYLDGKQVGSYRTSTDTYHPWDGARYGGDADPPVPVPRWAWPTPQQWAKIHGPKRALPTGVVSEKVQTGPAYSNNTGAISREQAFAQLAQAASLRDDSSRIWATVIGPDAERKPVEEFFKAHPEKGRIVINGYTRDDWQVAPDKFGALPPGEVVVLIQGRVQPDGTAFAHWLQTDGSLKTLAAGTTQALRKADPKWNPNRVDGPNGAGDPWAGWGVVASVVVFCLVVAAGVLGILGLYYLLTASEPEVK